jgi:hypothetical protein
MSATQAADISVLLMIYRLMQTLSYQNCAVK